MRMLHHRAALKVTLSLLFAASFQPVYRPAPRPGSAGSWYNHSRRYVGPHGGYVPAPLPGHGGCEFYSHGRYVGPHGRYVPAPLPGRCRDSL